MLNNIPAIFSLGDTAAIIDLGNRMDHALNQKVFAMQQWLQAHPFPGITDLIPAYCSLTVLYDPVLVRKQVHPATTVFEWVRVKLQEAWEQSGESPAGEAVLHRIPVCYEPPYGMDLAALATEKQLSVPAIIDLHTARRYRVYMIGFLPGFAYLGPVDEQLITPRKPQPVTVPAGSVGIAGAQTGIYPLSSPGGWTIIGRTPLKLFDPHAETPVPLKAGDEVQFFAVGKEEIDL